MNDQLLQNILVVRNGLVGSLRAVQRLVEKAGTSDFAEGFIEGTQCAIDDLDEMLEQFCGVPPLD